MVDRSAPEPGTAVELALGFRAFLDGRGEEAVQGAATEQAQTMARNLYISLTETVDHLADMLAEPWCDTHERRSSVWLGVLSAAAVWQKHPEFPRPLRTHLQGHGIALLREMSGEGEMPDDVNG